MHGHSFSTFLNFDDPRIPKPEYVSPSLPIAVGFFIKSKITETVISPAEELPMAD